MDRKLFIGDVVELKVPLLNNPAFTRGCVYEEYDLCAGPGVSIIFVNGEYDGFSPEEQDLMVEKVGHCADCEDFYFSNVMVLFDHFDDGYFKKAFDFDVG